MFGIVVMFESLTVFDVTTEIFNSNNHSYVNILKRVSPIFIFVIKY